MNVRESDASNFRYLQCGCINPKQWNARSILLPGSDRLIVAPLCNVSDKCYASAAAVFLTSESLMATYCAYCPPQCSVTSFNLNPSLWRAPPSWLMGDIKAFVERSGIPLPMDWTTNWRSHVESNYLSIELIHESSFVENYTQIATMKAIDALSNVGGQTGLWIGVSFLSLMELAEMLFRLVRYQIQIIRNKV